MWRFDGNFLFAPDGKTWPARSGGLTGSNPRVSYDVDGKALSLPKGSYRILRKEKGNNYGVTQLEMLIPKELQRTKQPIGWFFPLEPLFSTERGSPALGRFGIHPDGGLPGTDGCIGVYSGDYDALYKLLADRTVSDQLEVC